MGFFLNETLKIYIGRKEIGYVEIKMNIPVTW